MAELQNSRGTLGCAVSRPLTLERAYCWKAGPMQQALPSRRTHQLRRWHYHRLPTSRGSSLSSDWGRPCQGSAPFLSFFERARGAFVPRIWGQRLCPGKSKCSWRALRTLAGRAVQLVWAAGRLTFRPSLAARVFPTSCSASAARHFPPFRLALATQPYRATRWPPQE